MVESAGFILEASLANDVVVDVVAGVLAEIFSSFLISGKEVASGTFVVVVGSIWSSSSKKIIVEPVTTFFTGSEWCAVVSRAFM